MKLSDLVLYQRFDSYQLPLTAERALDLAVDGELPAFYLIDSDVTVHGPATPQADGVKYLGKAYGTWHSITVQVPRGILFQLALSDAIDMTDWEGKPTLLSVEHTLHSDLPPLESYLLCPVGPPIRFERNKLFFRKEDLNSLSAANEKTMGTTERRKVAQIISVLAGMAKVDLDKPYAAAAYPKMQTFAQLKDLSLPNKDTVAKWFSAAADSD